MSRQTVAAKREGWWIRFFGNESVILKNGRGDLLKFNNELCAALHNAFNVLSD